MSHQTQRNAISDKIHAAFHEGGYRYTRPRQRIANRLVQLAESGQDFSAEDLWNSLQTSAGNIGRATVFRAVDMLVNKRILNRIDFADGSHTYQACGDSHHHHLTCIKCHRVVEIAPCLSEDKFTEIGREAGFTIKGHNLTLFGYCSDCQP